MTNAIDKLMVNIGFKKQDVLTAPYRRILYVGIALMAALVATGLYLNIA